MSGAGPALLAASAGVGFGHAILPDHWVPLAVLGRARRFPLARVARLSALAGLAHVLVSIVLGAVLVAIGLEFRSTIQNAQDTIVGGLLILTGAGLAILELTGHGHPHGHHHHSHDHHAVHPDRPAPPHHHPHDSRRRSRLTGLAAVMVPFGAAASPDLTILPVFLAAATLGVTTALGSLAIFATVTIGTIVGLTLAATRAGYQLRGEWLERWGNLFSALVLMTIGALVLAQVV